jgi:hypothetical protein
LAQSAAGGPLADERRGVSGDGISDVRLAAVFVVAVDGNRTRRTSVDAIRATPVGEERTPSAVRVVATRRRLQARFDHDRTGTHRLPNRRDQTVTQPKGPKTGDERCVAL